MAHFLERSGLVCIVKTRTVGLVCADAYVELVRWVGRSVRLDAITVCDHFGSGEINAAWWSSHTAAPEGSTDHMHGSSSVSLSEAGPLPE